METKGMSNTELLKTAESSFRTVNTAAGMAAPEFTGKCLESIAASLLVLARNSMPKESVKGVGKDNAL